MYPGSRSAVKHVREGFHGVCAGHGLSTKDVGGPGGPHSGRGRGIVCS